jgi:hypothetical protein
MTESLAESMARDSTRIVFSRLCVSHLNNGHNEDNGGDEDQGFGRHLFEVEKVVDWMS